MATEMPKAYESAAVEQKWYPWWENNGLFKGKPNPDKKAYSIVIPPPNVTGILTMGHVLNNTLQDILIRWHKMSGDETCWFPGTDHAGIATEARVEKYLRENENTGRDELGREEFINRVWQWKEQYGGTIIRQLRTLGTSCDWERERFTMDEGLSDAVKEVFVQLYNKGYIYRGRRMINWCPKAKSALSDEEVIYKEENGKFYHFRYPLSDGSGYLVVATTRPETLFGDTAVAVHPDDPRYKDLIGKTVDLPLTDRKIPIIADRHADPEKGTGCVKITPAHDPNDFEVGKRHDLDFINVMNKDASLNERCGAAYAGLDRFVARKKVVEDIEKLGLLEKIEDLVHNVGYSERGNVPIETIISEQWFVRMEELAKKAIDAVRDGTIKFYPERWSKTYFHWMENIKDWCISRQIWWGHRIPAWYKGDEVYVGVNPPEGEGWQQEEDVLDTWFSSWLWPFSIMGWPEKTPEQDYFYPTCDLVTGPDIIFFWVARMIMAGYEFKGTFPFKNVYFTSIIRDDLGRKLSKSLGNSPDPLEVIATYGADALRFSIIYIAPVGMDIRYSNEKCEIGRNFANKLWNACRFRRMQGEVSEGFATMKTVDPAKLTADEIWMLSQLDQVVTGAVTALKEFRFHAAAHDIYELVWSSFCDWFIEACKPRLYGTPEEKAQALAVLDYALWTILRLLHPFMPFVTEELAHQLGFLKDDESIMNAAYPESFAADFGLTGERVASIMKMVDDKFQLIKGGRTLRLNSNIAPGKKIRYHIKAASPAIQDFLNAEMANMLSLLNASEISISPDEFKSDDGAQAPSILGNAGVIYLPLSGLVDVQAEIEKLNKQKKELQGWIKGTESKLGNAAFVAKAPPAVVEASKKQLAELKEKLERVEESLAAYSK